MSFPKMTISSTELRWSVSMELVSNSEERTGPYTHSVNFLDRDLIRSSVNSRCSMWRNSCPEICEKEHHGIEATKGSNAVTLDTTSALWCHVVVTIWCS